MSSYLYAFIINSNRTYRQIDCFLLCKQISIINTCGCYYTGYDLPLENLTMLRPCLTMEDYNCTQKEFFRNDLTSCQTNLCPLECNTMKYDYAVSSLIFPSVAAYYYNCEDNPGNAYVCSLSYEEYRIRKIKFTVYYSSLTYTHIAETPTMTITDLLASIGGSLSLIVGLSCFTLFEIGELVCLLVHALLRTALHNRTSQWNVTVIL